MSRDAGPGSAGDQDGRVDGETVRDVFIAVTPIIRTAPVASAIGNVVLGIGFAELATLRTEERNRRREDKALIEFPRYRRRNDHAEEFVQLRTAHPYVRRT
jgi:hypothetical protein